MDLVIFGDTHELHREVEVPTADLLSSPAISPCSVKACRLLKTSTNGLGTFHTSDGNWLCQVIMSSSWKRYRVRRFMISNATVLIDEAIQVDRLKIYGSPITPLYGGAFGKSSPTDGFDTGPVSPTMSMCSSRWTTPRRSGPVPLAGEQMGDAELMARVNDFPRYAWTASDTCMADTGG